MGLSETTTRPHNRQMVLKAIGFILLSVVFFDLQSVLARFLLDDYSPMELSAYRNVLGVLPSLVFLLGAGGLQISVASFRVRQWRLALFRGVLVAFAQLLFYLALPLLPLATIAALMQTIPMIIVALSWPLLGERAGVWRWSAVLIGFVGAYFVLQPGSEGFAWTFALPLGAALFYALSSVTLRLFDAAPSNALLYLYSSAASAVCAILIALFTTSFSEIQNDSDIVLILLMSFAGGSGVLCLMLGYRTVPPAIVAPFNYFGLLSAFLFGWLIFNEAPFGDLFPGSLFILAGGAVILWRERGA